LHPRLQDLYVGAEVVINRFNFALANADEYTLAFMENNKHLFIMGDGGAVLKLLKAQLAVRGQPCSRAVAMLWVAAVLKLLTAQPVPRLHHERGNVSAQPVLRVMCMTAIAAVCGTARARRSSFHCHRRLRQQPPGTLSRCKA
jgi:hypothetical protein